MWRTIRALFRRTEAQDLIEYTLLLAFIALVGTAFALSSSNGIAGVWTSSNTMLARASIVAGGPRPSQSTGGNRGGGGGQNNSDDDDSSNGGNDR